MLIFYLVTYHSLNILKTNNYEKNLHFINYGMFNCIIEL